MKADPAPAELTETQAYLVLNALPGVGPALLRRLLAGAGGDPRRVLAMGRERGRDTRGIRPETAAALADWPGHFDLGAEERRLAAAGATFVAPPEEAYPPSLRRMADPPAGLYRLGPVPPGGRAVAIVGTRRATSYGATVARRLAAALVERDFCIVSGLAEGIDTAAHEAALAAGGRTLAVLGTGLDLVYPPANRDLHRRMAERGALLSEFPFGRPASRHSFPRRNRLVAGLSEAVVVVESGAAGGAMITARFAGEQGRPVLAVPGRIDQPTSAGCHQLIRDGAALCAGVEDVLRELDYLGDFQPPPLAAPPGGPPAAAPDLTADEARLLAALGGGESLPPDGLARRTGLAAGRISAALMMLELKGRVARQLDGAYEAL